ncbi:undecaprenyl-diphosphate phosphatase [Oceanobacillus caeni]|uniref:Undecaprenyl-diphosphatase n=1 Tax=Oceanobacillus caeni TaxID=405946 RepID=A0ABR5MHP7_9BACI|nr:MULTISPECIES: undecaprenyl-diphosphate phosphatase [Bacillaceae]KKE80099.1 UDP pyrophosphate phosphatase [Bacilli bacterium VT-13-104]PZD85966.1 undecaprenyl-diphosphate phosphatase [Bacilli bacterium]KPH73520.1 UDP pyrophosphate phosphatase [Oceanobacillus caeni]MBU8790511.1 undecaprenyl-diphosphate phosphatase [Oceanobacillus caeni]MCR1835278.1 undecaprenyl-diphosphate phosphatase [Oceanobacillus caeni]
MEFIELLKAIILGLVEGLTEFAPVSSTGHMILVDDMWLKSTDFLGKYAANTFKIVIQLGSILAVVVVFKDRFIDLLGLNRVFNKKEQAKSGPHLKLTHIIVGLLPAGIFGLLFEDYIDEYLFTTKTVLVGLLIGAIFMIVADLFRSKNPKVVSVDQISYKQAFSVGLIQCLSLWPGFSRSGATISGGVLLGMNHRTASDFTFIMAVPIMAGASFLSLLKNWEYFTLEALPFFIVGFISAFVFALVSIRFFLKLINKVKLVPFAIYRIILVIVIYFLYF